jgi:hypothetical protein
MSWSFTRNFTLKRNFKMATIRFSGSPTTTAVEVTTEVINAGGTVDHVDDSTNPIEFTATFPSEEAARGFLTGFWSAWFDEDEISTMIDDAFVVGFG